MGDFNKIRNRATNAFDYVHTEETPFLHHEACAELRDDGMWEGHIKHFYEGHREKLEEMYGDDVRTGRMLPQAIDPLKHPTIYRTVLHHKHATREKALAHVQIHVDCLNDCEKLIKGT